MTREQTLHQLASIVVSRIPPHPLRVAIDGIDAAGKTTLADELAPLIEAQGRPVIRASIDGFGCVSFFCTKKGSGKIEEKRAGERREHESEEEQTRAESADAIGERRTAGCLGNDPLAHRAPESDGGRDRREG